MSCKTREKVIKQNIDIRFSVLFSFSNITFRVVNAIRLSIKLIRKHGQHFVIKMNLKSICKYMYGMLNNILSYSKVSVFKL